MLKVFHDARNGQPPPVLDFETQLEATLQYIDPYKILTFTPKNIIDGLIFSS